MVAGIVSAFFLLGGTSQEDTKMPTGPPPAAASSPSPVGQPGIDEPVIVEGLELQIASADLADSYTSEFSQEVFRPTSPQDTLLVVAGTVDGTVEDVHDWKVRVTEDQGERIKPGLTSTTTEGSSAEVEWVFVVSKSAGSFVLNLPGGVTVDLTSVVNGS